MLPNEQRDRLQNLKADDVRVPDYAVLTFAVCTDPRKGCGWGGWLLEGGFEVSPDKSDILANGDHPMPSVNNQIRPACKATLFRTETAQVFDRAGDASIRMKPIAR